MTLFQHRHHLSRGLDPQGERDVGVGQFAFDWNILVMPLKNIVFGSLLTIFQHSLHCFHDAYMYHW